MKISSLYRGHSLGLGRARRHAAGGSLDAFEIRSLPMELDCRQIVGPLLGRGFLLCNDLGGRRTYLVLEAGHGIGALERSVPGFSAERKELDIGPGRYTCMAVYNHDEERQALDGLYRVLGGTGCKVIVSFAAAEAGQVGRVRERVEHLLSTGEVRLTRSLGPGRGSSVNSDLYYGSDRRQVLASMLEMLNRSMLANGHAYNICVYVEESEGSAPVLEYLKSSLFVLGESDIHVDGMNGIMEDARGRGAVPL